MKTFRRHDDIVIKMWFGRTPTPKLAKQLRCTEDELIARAEVLHVKDTRARQAQQAAPKPQPVAKPAPAPKPPKPKPEPKRKKAGSREWTEEQEHALTVDYPDMDNDELATKYARTKASIVQRASRLGLRKSPEFLSRLARTRQRSRREQVLSSLRSAKTAMLNGNTDRALEHVDRALQAMGGGA